MRRPRWYTLVLAPLLRRQLQRTTSIFCRFLPVLRTRFVRGPMGSFVLVQRYVAGAVPLRELPDAQLYQPAVAAALQVLLAGVERCWAQTGWMPDIGGRVYVPGELYDVRRTDNLVLDADGQWWLVDVGATALFHHRVWPTGTVHTHLMLAAARRFAAELTARRGVPDLRWSTRAAG